MQAVEGLSLRGIWGGGAFRGVCRAPWFRAQRAPAFGPGAQAGSAPVGRGRKVSFICDAWRESGARRAGRGRPACRAFPLPRLFWRARAQLRLCTCAPGFSARTAAKGRTSTRCGEALDPRPPCGGGGRAAPAGTRTNPRRRTTPPQKISPCGKSRRDLISNNLCISPRQTCRLSRTCRIFRICQPSQTSRLCPRRTPLALRFHRHARVPLP